MAMLTRVRVFLKSLNHDTVVNQVLSLEVATAVLLFEVIRADEEYTEEEKRYCQKMLIEQFSLERDEVDAILAAAEDESFHATDYYRYTSLVNKHFTLGQRIEIVERLWQLALSDGKLDTIEEHTIRKIADLLHLNHQEYIQTKIAVQNAG
ncbi:TerB family tellurite resistance protein [Thalassotalea litorea]|uniref:TerB family tellurite resistance protein n=2 Tax=Thalassotalea litorea TaxID=2020715 RepID=A0A5R9IVG9_9GAMM|nr:TerB family tellurite resistance protein [Thalassotalea litorea]